MAMSVISIVGCGPGGLSCVTGEAHEAVRNAGVLIGAKRLLDLFPESGALRIAVNGSVEGTISAVIEHRNAGVAVLVTGDPGIASLARGIVAHFGRDACRVIPGISSVQVAFARLGRDWTDARIVNAHSGTPATSYRSLAGEQKIAVLVGSPDTTAWVAGLAEQLGAKWQCYLAQDLTLPGECVCEVALTELRRHTVPTRSVLVFLRKGCS